MAIEAEIFSEKLGLSRDYIIPTFPNLSHPLQNHQPQLQLQPQQIFLEAGMGMRMGMELNISNQGIGSYPCSSSMTTNAVAENSLPFYSLLNQHKREVDLYVHSQGEKLKEVLHHQKRQQMQYLISNYELRTRAILKEKDENFEKLRGKTELLEEYLRNLEQETEAWQRIAMEKQEMVNELNNMLLIIQQNPTFSIVPRNDIISVNHGEDDAESVNECEAIDKNNISVQENLQENHQEIKNKIVCKWCNSGKLCVVFLPCQHLCCCKNCESILRLCPVCYSVKQNSIEVFF